MARRTTIMVDDEVLVEAQRVLGTSGLKATVDAALREVINASLRRDLAERLETGKGFDRELLSKEGRHRMWHG